MSCLRQGRRAVVVIKATDAEYVMGRDGVLQENVVDDGRVAERLFAIDITMTSMDERVPKLR